MNPSQIYQQLSPLYVLANNKSQGAILANPTNQQLITLLFNHKCLIQNLLENQSRLQTKVQKLILIQNKPQTQSNDDIRKNRDNFLKKEDTLFKQYLVPFHQKVKKTNQHHTSTNTSDGHISYKQIFQKNQQSRQKTEKINQQIKTSTKYSEYKMKIQSKFNAIQIVSTCPGVQNHQNFEISSSEQGSQHSYKMQEKQSKGCETKNVIKNYGKSILTFIRKNKDIVKNMCEQDNCNEKEFLLEFQRFRGKVNSISELKVFWTEEGNKFSKLFRILSNFYLKRHSIKHTFNSRVKNYGLHIKYRKRLLDILKNPSDFSCLKCF